MAYSYLIWLFCFVVLPLAVLWALFGHSLRKYSKVIALAPIGALVFSIPWDIISVKENIWYFEEPYIAGLWYGGLPLEEYLFIVFVTLLFATVTVLVWQCYGETI